MENHVLMPVINRLTNTEKGFTNLIQIGKKKKTLNKKQSSEKDTKKKKEKLEEQV